MRIIITLLFLFIFINIHSQFTIKVHFLYGSTPIKKYKDEPKWFGGKLGGHVGIESSSSAKIFNFVPSGKFHVFQHKKDKHSDFTFHDKERFYSILGGSGDSMKMAVVHIPITEKQQQQFDSLSRVYKKETPYDYAFFGMRCGAAAYDVLAQLDILPAYSYNRTWNKIFYPKKLRRKLFELAKKNDWKVERKRGSKRRNWEKD